MEKAAFFTYLSREFSSYYHIHQTDSQRKIEKRHYLNGLMKAARFFGVSYEELKQVVDTEYSKSMAASPLAALNERMEIPTYIRLQENNVEPQMSDQYNDNISKHYAAYRPPLHQLILKTALPESQLFACGLDIGCGTGVSSVALSRHCESVIGIDPSESMIGQAEPTELIRYCVGSGENLPLEEKSVDIVTFAGSLSYAKSDALVQELKRVCRQKAWVVVYDFEVHLNPVMESLGIKMQASPSDYDHAINFSDVQQFNELAVKKETVSLEVTAEQLAHVLFSSTNRYSKLTKAFGGENAFENVEAKLEESGEQLSIEADIYVSSYQINTR
ncbi:putative methyltransferase YcgJ [Grimontia celer]|uniref:Putative methyltransferase YcgJ n=1 Tax=Grimontia celer TaxID=1796497 RepID=A0A128EUE0_9GAMM|nr:class I SAM-dependent methyltransferase [Grimontia celer]CZF77631.1 putative methyltransferase YcgJ [Grimontia celer]